MRPTGKYKSHDIMTYILRSIDFGLYETSRNIQEPSVHDMLRGWARSQVLPYQTRFSAIFASADKSYLTHPYPTRGVDKNK